MAPRVLQQSTAVKPVQGKSILRVGVPAASLHRSKKEKKKQKTAAAECFLPSFDPIIRNGCLFCLLATTAAYGLSIGHHVIRLGQWETPVAQSCAYIPSECPSSSDHPFDALRRGWEPERPETHTRWNISQATVSSH